MEGPIITPLKQEHKDQGIIDVGMGHRNYRFKYRKLIIAAEQEHKRTHKPYCFRCAYIDLEQQQEKEWRSKGARTGVQTQENVPITLNLKDYGEDKRFKLLGTSPLPEEILQDGLKNEIIRKQWAEYQCKIRGCGHSVLQPIKIPK